MKIERIKVAANKNAEITVKDAGGKFGVVCIGPGWVEVAKQPKPKRKTKKT